MRTGGKEMEERGISLGKMILVVIGNIIVMALTVIAAYNLQGYITEMFGYLPTLTYSVIGVLLALILTCFILRLDSIPLKAIALGVPFMSLYLFLKMILENDMVMIMAVIIILSSLVLTFLKLRKKSLYFTMAILFMVTAAIVMEMMGLELRELLITYNLFFFNMN